MPQSAAPLGWKWVALTDVARLESGHTPSRKHHEYWGGEIPWVSIRDAKAHHTSTIYETIESTNELGIANSSARILPAGTVCLSRTASVGYVVIMGRPMATSQDFVNWVCSKHLEPRFLQYLLIVEGPSLSRFSSGAVHQTIYFPEVKAFHICLPPIEEQRRLVAVLDEAFAAITTASAKLKAQLELMGDLRKSLLSKAFVGEFRAREAIAAADENFATPEFAAQILAFAHFRHVSLGRAANFGHVKAQKTFQSVEAIGGLDLGREPIKDAAGPNDFAHMRQTEDWARQHGFFEFVQRSTGGYDFCGLENYDKLLDEAKRRLDQAGTNAKRAIELLVDMDSDFAEIVMTTHAAWNNLILDRATITDDAIVRAARDDWHRDKLRYDKSRFHDAIRFIRSNGIEPNGSAKRVGGQESLPL